MFPLYVKAPAHCSIFNSMTSTAIVPVLFEYLLSDKTDGNHPIPMQQAKQLMQHFAANPRFNWKNSHNGCEARADAICVLLEHWQIPCYKAWVFSGHYLKKHIGGLKQNWNYHVAPLLPVSANGEIVLLVIDPATAITLQPLYNWAAGVTAFPHSYIVVKEAHWYIFSDHKITRKNWNPRNRQNRKWMIQGLAGINSLNTRGKSAFCVCLF